MIIKLVPLHLLLLFFYVKIAVIFEEKDFYSTKFTLKMVGLFKSK